MAGTSTASRASWGVIASSYGQNPTPGSGALAYNAGVQGNFSITNIPTTQWKDLELYIHWGQQSTWTGQGYWYFTDQTNAVNPNQGCYNYWGWSTGSSNGTAGQTSQYVYPVSYSNMWSSMRLYCANAFSDQNTKAWWYEAGNSSGNSSSYATLQSGAGVFRSSYPITAVHVNTPWGNGSSSYQGWLLIGRNPK